MNHLIAKFLYFIGIEPKCSTFVCNDIVTVGYGKLDQYGCWQYPLRCERIITEFESEILREEDL